MKSQLMQRAVCTSLALAFLGSLALLGDFGGSAPEPTQPAGALPVGQAELAATPIVQAATKRQPETARRSVDLRPAAARGSVRGRVVTLRGRGVGGATVRLTAPRGQARIEAQFDAFAWVDGLPAAIDALPTTGDSDVVHDDEVDDEVLATTATAADGSFLFARVAPADVVVEVRADGYEAAISPPFAVPGDRLSDPVTLVVAPARALRGVVVDHAGQPVEGADIVVARVAGPLRLGAVVARTTAGTSGEFVCPSLGTAEYAVTARAPGLAPAGVRGVRCGDPIVRLVLHRGARVAGRVFDIVSDRGLAGARVLAVSDLVPGFIDTECDSEGRYVLNGVPAVPGLRLLVRAAPYRAMLSPASQAEGISKGWFLHEPPQAGTELRLDLPMVRGGTAAGRVVDAESGAPVVGAEVLVLTDRMATAEAIGGRAHSAADGSFSIDGVPPGEVVLVATCERYAPACDDEALCALVRDQRRRSLLRPGQQLTGLEIEMRRAVALRGRVLTAAGEPVSGARVECVGADDDPVRAFFGLDAEALGRIARTDHDGGFTLEVPPDADLVLTAGVPGDAARATEQLAAGAPDVTLIVQRPAALHGRLLAPDGQPVADAVLHFVATPQGVLLEGMARRRAQVEARTDAHGHFALLDLAAGSGYLELARPARWELETDVQLAAGEATRQVFRARAALGITGRVVDDRGRPVAQSNVTAVARDRDGEHPVMREVFTDDQGHFALWRLPPGDYALRATHPDLLAAAQSPTGPLLTPTAALVRAGAAPVRLVQRWTTLAAVQQGWGSCCQAENPAGNAAPAGTRPR